MAKLKIGEAVVPAQEPKIYNDDYKHSIVQSTYVPNRSLLSNVTGDPVMVEWYSPYTTIEEESIGYQPNGVPTYQSYIRIKGLIIKSENFTTFMFDSEKATSKKRGTAYVIYDLAPKKNCLFIADMGDGRAGLFQITEPPEPTEIAVDKCYRIEFELIAFVTKEISEDLERKVVKEYTYSKEAALAGGRAILTVEGYDNNQKLNNLINGISRDLMRIHFFKGENTIVVPNEKNKIVYDPYLARFLMNVIPQEAVNGLRQLRLVNENYYTTNRNQDERTVWDMFYEEGFRRPSNYKAKYYIHNRKSLLNTRYYGNIFNSKIDYLINVHEYGASKLAYMVQSGRFYWLPDDAEDMKLQGAKGEDQTYYFSEDFYNGGGTEKELFIWKVFRDNTMSKSELIKLMEGWWDLPPIDQVYLGGIYILAAKRKLVDGYGYL